MKQPPWIDPATGKLFANYLAPVPGLGRPITEVTLEEFLGAFRTQDFYPYFCQLGWPEGAIYCYNLDYLKETGFPCILKQALILEKQQKEAQVGA